MQIVSSLSAARWCHSNCICSLNTAQCNNKKRVCPELVLFSIVDLNYAAHKLEKFSGSGAGGGGDGSEREETALFLEVVQLEAGVTSAGKRTIWEFLAAVDFPVSKNPSRNLQALTPVENQHSQSEAGSGVSPQCVKIMTSTTQSSVNILI